MPLHHAARKSDTVPPADLRIFSHDKRYHKVGIAFDRRADDRQRPQDIQHILHQHIHAGIHPSARPQEKQQPLQRHFFVGAAFQKHPATRRAVNILDQKPKTDAHSQHENADNEQNRALRKSQPIKSLDKFNEKQPARQVIDEIRKHPVRPAERRFSGVLTLSDRLLRQPVRVLRALLQIAREHFRHDLPDIVLLDTKFRFLEHLPFDLDICRRLHLEEVQTARKLGTQKNRQQADRKHDPVMLLHRPPGPLFQLLALRSRHPRGARSLFFIHVCMYPFVSI